MTALKRDFVINPAKPMHATSHEHMCFMSTSVLSRSTTGIMLSPQASKHEGDIVLCSHSN